ncbi:MAG: hypothetical protein JNL32_16470 [Candidatus Kapabacteria bacterium]|nr:hypothetical protein [Candidatus Kapabacteria bacterium]
MQYLLTESEYNELRVKADGYRHALKELWDISRELREEVMELRQSRHNSHTEPSSGAVVRVGVQRLDEFEETNYQLKTIIGGVIPVPATTRRGQRTVQTPPTDSNGIDVKEAEALRKRRMLFGTGYDGSNDNAAS